MQFTSRSKSQRRVFYYGFFEVYELYTSKITQDPKTDMLTYLDKFYFKYEKKIPISKSDYSFIKIEELKRYKKNLKYKQIKKSSL